MMKQLCVSASGAADGGYPLTCWFHVRGPGLNDADYDLVKDKLEDTLEKLNSHLGLVKETNDA